MDENDNKSQLGLRHILAGLACVAIIAATQVPALDHAFRKFWQEHIFPEDTATQSAIPQPPSH